MRTVYLALCCVVCLCFSLHTHSRERLPVGVSIFPPFKYLENDQLVGSDTEIVSSVLEKIGYQPDFYIRPWKRIQEEAKKGQYALVFTLTKSKEREEMFLFTDPISAVRDVFFKRQDEDFQWESFRDLNRVVISASKGYNYDASFLTFANNPLTRINWALGNQPELEHLKRLSEGTVDIAICEVSVCQYLIKKHHDQFSRLDYIDKSIGPVRTFHAAIYKSWPEADLLLQNFNLALHALIQSGERDRIFKKYAIASLPE